MNCNMKTFKTILLMSLIAITTISMAQSKRMMKDGDRKEEIEAMKVGFLTKRLSLSPEEAKTFWPVYDQYQNELNKIREARRSEIKDAKENTVHSRSSSGESEKRLRKIRKKALV